MSVASIQSGKTITVVVDFSPVVIPSSHPNYDKIVELAQRKDTTEADIKPLIDIPAAIDDFTGGNVKVVNGRLFYKGFEVRTSLAKLILEFVKQGKAEAAKPFELFLERAHANPDPRAAQDLYDWVAAAGLPITEDGFVLGWKAVRNDYFSIHGYNAKNPRFDHHIGNVVEQDRTLCDANPDRTCSSGLHFCAASYLSNYGGGGSRIVVVKIDPADVVAFPKDYNLAKGRAAKYQVVGEVPLDKVPTYYPQGLRVTSQFDAYTTLAKVPTPKAPAKKSNGKFTEGETWKRRDNRTVTIIKVDGGDKNGRYPIVDSTGATFDLKGRYVSKKADPRDLMTRV